MSQNKQLLINNVSEKILEIIDSNELNCGELIEVLEKVRTDFLELAIIPQKRKVSRDDRLK